MSVAAYPLIADWVGTDGSRLVIRTGKVDIGQRISTALTQIAHEELAVPLDLIDVAPVRTGHAPDEGITSGSNSIEQSGHALRCAAATLRDRIIALAIARFGGDRGDWQIADGILHLPGINHRCGVIDLIDKIPADATVDPDVEFRSRLGPSPKPGMRGLADMVCGRFVYVHDLDFPGMLHARVIHPPQVNARLAELKTAAVGDLEGKGFRVVRDGSFLAIAGPHEWPVVQAALALANACVWDVGTGLPEGDVFLQLNPKNAQRFEVIDGIPQIGAVPDRLVKPDISARYERSYQMHAALGPSAALAKWDGQKLTVHSHSQGIYPLRDSIADSLSLDPAQVEITHTPGSGCYGHNGADDAAFEAALIAMSLPNCPILLKWSREDEHGWEPYAPAMAVELAARIAEGRITAYSVEVFSDTHRGRPRPGANRAGPAKLLANRFRAAAVPPHPAQPNMGRHAGMHRNLDPIYAFPDKRLIKNLVTGMAHRTSAMRTLGAAANIFALESFLDEIACQNGADRLEFRRTHLTDPLALAVLDELGRRIDRRPDLAESAGRGMAYAQYKNQMTRVGVCVDVEVNDRAEVRLGHAIIVADAGRVIDAEGLSAQLEGGLIQAASWALHEEVTWDRDGVTSRNWESYPVIRFDNIPTIDIAILDRPDAPSLGAGEASSGPVVAAIANAIFDAVGIRMRRIPFTPDAIRKAAAMDEADCGSTPSV